MFLKYCMPYVLLLIMIPTITFSMWFDEYNHWPSEQKENYIEQYSVIFEILPPIMQYACKERPHSFETKFFLKTMHNAHLQTLVKPSICDIKYRTKELFSHLYFSPQTEDYAIKVC